MRICLAPMDGITDCAYRIVCQEVFAVHGNPADELMTWTEFMSADGYCHNPPGVIKHLRHATDAESGLIAQIFGGDAETLLSCALDIQEKYPFAGIELNMGCPSPKVMKCAAGSGMLRDKQQTLEIIKQLSEQLTVPFSLKTRTWLTQDDVEEQFDFLIEASKYVWLVAVHGRTYKQSHSGDVNREFLYRLKQRLPEKVIIGNGGIRSYDEAVTRLSPTNVPEATSPLDKGGARRAGDLDAASVTSTTSSNNLGITLDWTMIAQSAIWNPRILTPHEPSPTDRLEVILRHLDLAMASEICYREAVDQMEEKIALPVMADLEAMIPQIDERLQKNDESRLVTPIEFRKYLFNYIRGLPDGKKLKQEVIRIREYRTLKEMLISYFSQFEM